MADSNKAGQAAYANANPKINGEIISAAEKSETAVESLSPATPQLPALDSALPRPAEVNPNDDAQTLDQAMTPISDTGYSPALSFSDRIAMLGDTGKLEYPEYRTLSQQQRVSYEKAMNSPEYQRLSEKSVSDLISKTSSGTVKQVKNSLIQYAGDALSFDRTELWLGNILATDDWGELGSMAAQAASWLGGKLTGALGMILSPTELGDATLTPETIQRTIQKRLAEGQITRDEAEQALAELAQKQSEAAEKYKADMTASLKQSGKSDEEIQKILEPKDSKINTIGKEMVNAAMRSLEYKAAVLPQGTEADRDAFVSKLTGGALSMGELLLAGVGGRTIGTNVSRQIINARRATPAAAARFEAITGRQIASRTGLTTASRAGIERAAQTVGGQVGSIASLGLMTNDIMGGGAYNDILNYIETTGDSNLENYTGDIRKTVINAANATVQNWIENKWGINKFIKNPRLATKYGEWVNGFIQEFTQGGVEDIAEYIKGNQSIMDVLANIGNNIEEGLIGALLQGATGTAVYHYHHRKSVGELREMVMAQNPNISYAQAEAFAERKVVEIEEGVAKDVVKDIVQFTDAQGYQGELYDTIRKNIELTIDAQREAMKDTVEGSKFDEMTEDERAQHIGQVAADTVDRITIHALETGTPLSEVPQLRGNVIDGTYYIEGSDYARRTEEENAQRREQIKAEVYARRQAEKSAKDAARAAERAANQAKRAAEQAERTAQKTQEQEQKAKDSQIKKNIRGGDVAIIGQILSDNGFRTRDMDGTTIKKLALLNPQLFEGKDLGMTAGKYAERVARNAIERNTESGNDVLLRAGYSQEQINKMDDATWNRLVQAAYREENAEEIARQEKQQREAAEALEQIDLDEIGFQDDEQFDLADEMARLDAENPAYTGETITVDGKERTVYNSNGDRIAKSKPALENFWRWFGDSKVVDEQGRPLVVYHGTSSDFDTFDIDQSGKNTGTAIYGEGFYFTTNKDVATKWGAKRGEPIVMPVYIKLENPNMVEALSYPKNSQEKGFDGVIAQVWGGKDLEVVAFESNQIKSTENRGTFSPDTGNIYYQTQNQAGKGGAYDARNRSVTLGAKADATTLPHELAHYWIDKNFKWARSGNASQAWLNSWRAVEKYLGIDPEDKVLDNSASEKFARAYERFLADEQLPLVMNKSLADFRDFVADHYDYDLDDARGLQDKFGRPIKLDDNIKNWFRKAGYAEYMNPGASLVFEERKAQETREEKVGARVYENNNKIIDAANAPANPIIAPADIAGMPTASDVQTVSNDAITGRRQIGGGEMKQSQGEIGQAVGKQYESTTWDIQENMVKDYLAKTSLDDAIIALETDTYPQNMDANFLRAALIEELNRQGREDEAAQLVLETAESFTEAAQTLQAARRLNSPFVSAINQMVDQKAEKLARARYGNNKKALSKLDAAINKLITKYESDFLRAEGMAEINAVYDAMLAEAARTIGTLDKTAQPDIQFQTVEERRAEAKEKKALMKRGSVKAYRSRAKALLKQKLGLAPTKEQIRELKRLSANVSKVISKYRAAVRAGDMKALDIEPVLNAQNELNNYMVSQVGASKMGQFADATNSFMMANMLWNPSTNVKNIAGNIVQMVPHVLGSLLKYGKGTISAKTKLELLQNALKIQSRTGYNIFSLTDFFDRKTLWAEKYYEPTTWLGKGIRAPLTLLGLSDTIFKGFVFLNHADAMASNMARAEAKENGWNAEQTAKRAEELFYQALNTDPRTMTLAGNKIRSEALLEGEEATYTQSTAVSKYANQFRRMLNFGKQTGVGNLLIPFTSTIANIAHDAVANWTFGTIKEAVKNPKMLLQAINPKIDAEMRKDAWKTIAPEYKNLIKNVMGLAILLLYAVTAGDDDDFVLDYNLQTDKDKDIRQNRNAPYGTAVRIGDKWIQLDIIASGFLPLQTYLTARRHNFTADGWIQGIFGWRDLVPGWGEMESLISDYQNSLKYNKGSDTEAIGEILSEQGTELLTRLVPAAALFNQIGNITDDVKRQKYNKWYDKLIGRLPWLRETLPEATSKATGEAIPQTDTFWNVFTGGNVRDYKPATASDKVRYEFIDEGKPLNFKESSSRLKELGTDTKEFQRAVAEVRQIFNRELGKVATQAAYKNMDIEEKRKYVVSLHSKVVDQVATKYGIKKKKPLKKSKK